MSRPNQTETETVFSHLRLADLRADRLTAYTYDQRVRELQREYSELAPAIREHFRSESARIEN